MVRSKAVSDEDVLDGLLAAVARHGPDRLTFSRASQAVKLSAATLVQRFGTREAMIEAVLRRAWDRLDAATAAADALAPVDPAGAISILMQLMPGDDTEYSVADGLLLLREDLRNAALRKRGSGWGAHLAHVLGRRLTGGSEGAERLGWQMASVWQGALIWWAFRRDADAETAIRTVLEDWCRSIGVMSKPDV